MNKNMNKIHMNMWCKTTFILQLYMECVCEILTELDSLDFEQNGAASSCLPPVTVTAHRDGPTLSSVLLFEQLQLASSHTSWVGCKSPKEVLLEWKCCWNGSAHTFGSSHTQQQLVSSWAQTYKINVAPFTCFSRYLQ